MESSSTSRFFCLFFSFHPPSYSVKTFHDSTGNGEQLTTYDLVRKGVIEKLPQLLGGASNRCRFAAGLRTRGCRITNYELLLRLQTGKTLLSPSTEYRSLCRLQTSFNITILLHRDWDVRGKRVVRDVPLDNHHGISAKRTKWWSISCDSRGQCCHISNSSRKTPLCYPQINLMAPRYFNSRHGQSLVFIQGSFTRDIFINWR